MKPIYLEDKAEQPPTEAVAVPFERLFDFYAVTLHVNGFVEAYEQSGKKVRLESLESIFEFLKRTSQHFGLWRKDLTFEEFIKEWCKP